MAVFLNATLLATGLLELGLNGAPWLESGAVVYRSNAVWYSSACAPTDTCEVISPSEPTSASGHDAVGDYHEISLVWSPSSSAAAAAVAAGSPPVRMVTGVRTYPGQPSVAVLTQSFPDGL